MNQIANNIKQRLSLREPLAEALDVVARLADKIDLKKPLDASDDTHRTYLAEQLHRSQEICPFCKDFERDFPSYAFSIATGIGKTRLMGACIAYLHLAKGIRHFFILAPNLTLYEKLIRDFGEPSYEKYVFKGIAEFVHNQPVILTSDNYNSARSLYSDKELQINIFNIAKFNSDSKEGSKKGSPKMRRLSEYLGLSYFDYLASLDDLVILMDEAHRYHADASKKAINELRPILGLEMTATPTDEKGKPFKNIVYEYNLAQALDDGKYVKIPTVAKRKNFVRGSLTDDELDALKIEDAINIHERTKVHLELYAKNNHLPLVKPFILIACRNITHATQTIHLIEEKLFGGRYKGKVLQIDSSTKKDEEVERLYLSLEKPENQIEIVIHVNMLKEGWDVTNLYTIVPLRAGKAPILVEQSIGRGLRLPYGGKRTGDADVDKLTVIAHDNFEAVIEKAQDPKSVLSRYSYVELEDDYFKNEPSKVVPVQTILDIQETNAIAAAKTDAEKQQAKSVFDARRAVWKVIPQLNTAVKSKAELQQPKIKKVIKELAAREIQESTKVSDPLFAAEIAATRIEEIDHVVDVVVDDFVKNIIEIPRMTIQKEIFKSEFKWFDLDTSLGFDLPALQEELIRVSIGVGEHSYEHIAVQSGQGPKTPINQIIEALVEHDEIDYDENAELMYHLAQQALDAVSTNLSNRDDLPQVVKMFKQAIAENIYSQMMRHHVIYSTGYVKPKVLPFVGIIEQNITEVEGYGRRDFRDIVPASILRKVIFTGFLKSYYTECKFDSVPEHDFAYILEMDKGAVLRWLRPASNQFHIYWANGSRRYEPDFIVETVDAIYMVETKAAKEMTAEDVLAKKEAAETYCRYATEYTLANGGKPWRYKLLAHDKVNRSVGFSYLMAL